MQTGLEMFSHFLVRGRQKRFFPHSKTCFSRVGALSGLEKEGFTLYSTPG